MGDQNQTSEDKVKSYFRNIEPDWWNPKDTYPLIDTLEFGRKYVLDAGAGTGRFTLQFLQRDPSLVVALDISKNMLKSIKEKASSNRNRASVLALIQGDAENLPLKDNFFDIGVNILVFSHLVHPEYAIHEVSRTLKPTGLAVFDSECDNPVSHFSVHSSIAEKIVWFVYHTGLLSIYRLFGSGLYWKFNSKFLRAFTNPWYPYQRQEISRFAKDSELSVVNMVYSRSRNGYIIICQKKSVARAID